MYSVYIPRPAHSGWKFWGYTALQWLIGQAFWDDFGKELKFDLGQIIN